MSNTEQRGVYITVTTRVTSQPPPKTDWCLNVRNMRHSAETYRRWLVPDIDMQSYLNRIIITTQE